MDAYERVRKIVTGILNVKDEAVTLESSLTKDLGADSLDLVEISMAIEEQFGFMLGDEEAFALETVGQIVDCITEKTTTAGGTAVGAAQ
jgi:acyl carrier protein